MPDNYEYHKGLRSSLGMESDSETSPSTETLQRLEEFYGQFAEQQPASLASKRLPLDYLEGEAFVQRARSYVKGFLLKGIPSLFSDLKPLYRSHAKALALQSIFEEYSSAMTKTEGDADVDLKTNPQSVLWVHHFLAQHYDQMHDTEKALEHIQHALNHTPTVSEVHVVHSKILKHAGDLPGDDARGRCA